MLRRTHSPKRVKKSSVSHEEAADARDGMGRKHYFFPGRELAHRRALLRQAEGALTEYSKISDGIIGRHTVKAAISAIRDIVDDLEEYWLRRVEGDHDADPE